MNKLDVLVDCEASQTVCIEFRKLGHNAFSCDLEDAYGDHPEWHIKGDAIDALYSRRWDLVIAHPPCDRLANSGVRWLAERNLWVELDQAIEFFNEFISYGKKGNAIGIENPIQHKHARAGIEKYHQLIQPWQFGHPETKATCLWLYGLPKLKPTNIVSGREQRIWKLPPSEDRAKLRSKTYQGIAEAMAIQWSEYLSKPPRVENQITGDLWEGVNAPYTATSEI